MTYNTTERKTRKRDVKIGILKDMQNGQTMKRLEIAERYAVSERLVREIIAELNMDGNAIVSVGNGFHIAHDKKDIEHAAGLLKKQAITTIQRASRLLRITAEAYIKGLSIEMQSGLFDEGVYNEKQGS